MCPEIPTDTLLWMYAIIAILIQNTFVYLWHILKDRQTSSIIQSYVPSCFHFPTAMPLEVPFVTVVLALYSQAEYLKKKRSIIYEYIYSTPIKQSLTHNCEGTNILEFKYIYDFYLQASGQWMKRVTCNLQTSCQKDYWVDITQSSVLVCRSSILVAINVL